MNKIITITIITTLILIYTASAIQICFNIPDDQYEVFRTAIMNNHRYNPYITNQTSEQFTKYWMIQPWKQEIRKYYIIQHNKNQTTIPMS